jgi:hypothetical protein
MQKRTTEIRKEIEQNERNKNRKMQKTIHIARNKGKIETQRTK